MQGQFQHTTENIKLMKHYYVFLSNTLPVQSLCYQINSIHRPLHVFYSNMATCLMQNKIQINVQQVTGIVYLLYFYISLKTSYMTLFFEALLIQMHFQDPWKTGYSNCKYLNMLCNNYRLPCR